MLRKAGELYVINWGSPGRFSGRGLIRCDTVKCELLAKVTVAVVGRF